MTNKTDGLPTYQELWDLTLRAIRDFLDIARDLPIIDDPNCIANLPGYPDAQFEIIECSYRVTVVCREDFHAQETAKATPQEVEDLDGEVSFLTLWFENLFELLLRRWGWWGYLERFPLCYPNSFVELADRYRAIDLADTPEFFQREQDEMSLLGHLLFSEGSEIEDERIKTIKEKYENDPINIIDFWLNRFDFPRASLTKTEFDTLNRIRIGLFGSESGIPPDATDSSARAAGRLKKRNQGKANQARGIFIAHIELIRSGKTDQPPPGLAEIAKQVGCSKATVSRATKQLRDEYEMALRSGRLRGIKGPDGSLDAYDEDQDEE